jgi:hypothetical protein
MKDSVGKLVLIGIIGFLIGFFLVLGITSAAKADVSEPSYSPPAVTAPPSVVPVTPVPTVVVTSTPVSTPVVLASMVAPPIPSPTPTPVSTATSDYSTPLLVLQGITIVLLLGALYGLRKIYSFFDIGDDL